MTHVHEFRPVIRRVRGFEWLDGYRCDCGETKPRWDPATLLDARANAIAAARVYVQRRYGTPPWEPRGWNPWAALNTVEDYEACARGASPAVRHVRVLCAANGKAPAGEVEVRVRGPWRRRLKQAELLRVHRAVVEHSPVGVRLRVKS